MRVADVGFILLIHPCQRFDQSLTQEARANVGVDPKRRRQPEADQSFLGDILSRNFTNPFPAAGTGAAPSPTI